MSAIRFGSKLKEIRIHLCQSGSSSQGVREFIEKQYVNIKKANPNFPILVRECSGVTPRLWARFEFGKESTVSLSNMSSEDVLGQMQKLA